jgi:hypothetical protein
MHHRGLHADFLNVPSLWKNRGHCHDDRILKMRTLGEHLLWHVFRRRKNSNDQRWRNITWNQQLPWKEGVRKRLQGRESNIILWWNEETVDRGWNALKIGEATSYVYIIDIHLCLLLTYFPYFRKIIGGFSDHLAILWIRLCPFCVPFCICPYVRVSPYFLGFWSVWYHHTVCLYSPPQLLLEGLWDHLAICVSVWPPNYFGFLCGPCRIKEK